MVSNVLLLLCCLASSEIVLYPELPGFPIDKSVRLSVFDSTTRVEVSAARFDNSSQRAVGLPATSMNVARLGIYGRVSAFLRAFDDAKVYKTGSGEVSVRQVAGGIEFELVPGTFSVRSARQTPLALWIDSSAPRETIGAVTFSPGVHILDSPFVISSASAVLSPGAVLRRRREGDRDDVRANGGAFIILNGTNSSISGQGGTVDANGILGHAILIEACENCSISDVFVLGSKGWSLHARRSNTLRIHNVKIFSGADGIDIDSSHHVAVEDVFVNSWDDAFVVKTTQPSVAARHVTFSKIAAWTRKTAFKIGTESVADFSDIRFEKFDGYDLDRGCAVVVRDGASVRGVTFEDGRLYMKRWIDEDKDYATGLEIQIEHRHNDQSNSSIAAVRFSAIEINAGHDDMKAAFALKSIQARPLRAILFDHVTIKLSSPHLSQQLRRNPQHDIRSHDDNDGQKRKFLVDCVNTYVSKYAVILADLEVRWNENEQYWPGGVSPSWPRHSPPPAILIGPCRCDRLHSRG